MIVASCTTNFYSTCVRPYVTLVVFQKEIFCPYNPIRPNIQNCLVKANFPLQNFVAAGPLYGFPSCSRIRRRNSHHDFAVEGARDGGQGDEPRHELHRDGGQGARRHQRRPVGPLRPTDAGTNCIKIGLPGKSILGDYFQENMTSPRPLLILRISFQGRPILIQLLPGGGQLHLHLRAVSRGDGHAVEEDAAGLEVQLAEDVQVAPPARLPPQERQREGRHLGQGTRLRPQDARELLIRRRKW